MIPCKECNFARRHVWPIYTRDCESCEARMLATSPRTNASESEQTTIAKQLKESQ